jgi:hypothetical protein
MTQKIAKKHHYIPQFYLKGFASKSVQKKNKNLYFIWIYDKSENKWHEAETKSAFVVRDLYTLKESFASENERIGKVDKLERLLAEGLEKEFSELLNKIIENPHIPHKSSEDYSILIHYIALQYVRTPEQIERFRKWKLTSSYEISGLPSIEMAEVKDFVIQQIKHFSWKLAIIQNKSKEVFITSDYPFIEYYALENKPPKIIGLCFPISSKLMLIGENEPNLEPRVVIAKQEDVNTYNQEIYAKATRFVCSSEIVQFFDR